MLCLGAALIAGFGVVSLDPALHVQRRAARSRMYSGPGLGFDQCPVLLGTMAPPHTQLRTCSTKCPHGSAPHPPTHAVCPSGRMVLAIPNAMPDSRLFLLLLLLLLLACLMARSTSSSPGSTVPAHDAAVHGVRPRPLRNESSTRGTATST